MPDSSSTPPAPGARASIVRRLLERAIDSSPHMPPEIPGLMLIRIDHPFLNTCSVYEPCVAVIVQGSKRITLG
ncbi:MAG: AraC family transcriptional regulator N-terminal domain-containing protein, partial [Hydrogenophaga sp.]|nr:AraC family transcriptional regulator N-terminal domain-containing protein [Hydrogenophaga sp.]